MTKDHTKLTRALGDIIYVRTILHPDSEPHKVLEQALADLREVLAGEAVEPKPYVETFNAGPVMAGASFVITVVADGPIRSITDNNGNIWVGEQPKPQSAITRYQMVVGREEQAPYGLVPCEVEHPNGEWVRYEDARSNVVTTTKECEADQCRAQHEGLDCLLDEGHDGPHTFAERTKPNP